MQLYNLTTTVLKTKHTLGHIQPGYWPTKISDRVGVKSKIPIFIVGFFRSGSTLLESLLDKHEDIWGMGENSVFTYYMYQMQEDLMSLSQQKTSRNHKGQQSMNQEMSLILQRYGERIVSNMNQRHKDYLLGIPQMVNVSSPTSYRYSFLGTPQHPRSSYKAPKRIVDKMLLNYLNIALIHLVFPDAIILHTVRDPLDTLWSCMKNRFGDLSAYTLDFRSLVAEYVSYLHVVGHYRKILPVLNFKSGRRKAMVDIRYEQLVANPRRVIKEVIRLLEIDESDVDDEQVEEIVEDFFKSKRLVKTASYLQVKQPIYHSSVGQWKKYAKFLSQTVIPELRNQLNSLIQSQSLPFFDNRYGPRMNWELSTKFNYTELLHKLT